VGRWVATDVGGTFTDLVAFDETSGDVRLAKASTTPSEFSRGVMEVLARGEVELTQIDEFVHGCTVVINAITERKGARTALVTTAGFRDVLEIGRGNRPDMYNLLYHKPAPFVPRELRFEVTERVDFRGNVLRPLDLGEVEAVAEACRRAEADAVAICFLHAYANPSHEEACRERLAALLDGVSITTSSSITREWREYERSSTTVLNSYVKPVVRRYLDALEDGLRRGHFGGRPSVMQSNGGTASFATGRELPLYLIESGPVAGVIGAAQVGELIGEPNVISLDIGGTTAKCSLVEGGVPKITTQYLIEWSAAAAGHPIMVPVVDIVEIGAGGGSIAWVDAGALQLGPISAGADPGPACYGKGGNEPTVTDAQVIAGVINPAYFLGGELRLDPDRARASIARLGEHVGAGVEETANGIRRLANAKMAAALKLVSVRRGYDPREFVIVAFGGGGPMHAAALGAELQAKAVLIPPHPGHFSAWGMLRTQPRVDVLRTRVVRTADAEPDEIEAVFGELRGEALARFELDAGDDGFRFVLSADMRYVGQEHAARVEIASAALPVDMIERAFHAAHRRAYTFDLPGEAVEIVTFHVAAYRDVSRPQPRRLERDGRPAEAARKGSRDIDFDLDGIQRCAVYERDGLPAGFHAEGPLIVEEPAATTLVNPGQTLDVDSFGNLLVARAA
jgi:N-methylhydantoinase A